MKPKGDSPSIARVRWLKERKEARECERKRERESGAATAMSDLLGQLSALSATVW